MTPEEISEKAILYARANKKLIAREIADSEKYSPEDDPVSVFMAGSPGAGKTEASIILLERLFTKNNKRSCIRIDPDALREQFEDYTGTNSDLFQPAVSILVEGIHDLALKQSQSFILDGTLSSYSKAELNINRSLQRGRVVQILYVYQTPQQAWKFVQKRQTVEGRYIPPERFIDQYFKARENANALKRRFGNRIQLDILLKNVDGTRRFYRSGVDQIDHHIPEKYTKNEIESYISQPRI